MAAPPQIKTVATERIASPPPAAPGGSRTGSATATPLSAAATTQSGLTDRLGTGGFQECGGLDLEAELRDYLEGGGNDTVVRRIGRAKYVPIVLKRGMFVATRGGYADSTLWAWMTGMVSNQVPQVRYDGRIEVLDPGFRRVVARWTFVRGLPLKVVGPTLNASTGAVGIEELHVAHEGLWMEAS
jgi:phage tail-like protein